MSGYTRQVMKPGATALLTDAAATGGVTIDPLATDTAWPLVSVIVAARNAERTIAPCLASLGALDYPHVEVVVANDGSTDATARVARSAGVTVVDAHGRGPSAARNLAARQARGSILAFTDADCTVPRDWLKALVSGLLATGAHSVGGRQVNVFPMGREHRARGLDTFFAVASVVSSYTRSDTKPRQVWHVPSCNSAYRRDAFEAVHGFTEGLFPGEDVDLDRRLQLMGHRCFYIPSAVVSHHRPGTSEWFAQMMWRYGKSEREIVRRHGRFRLLHFVPLGLAVLGLSQTLLLWPPGRLPILVFDTAAALTGVAVLSSSAPPRLWPLAAWYGLIAVIQWTRGFWGLNRRPKS